MNKIIVDTDRLESYLEGILGMFPDQDYKLTLVLRLPGTEDADQVVTNEDDPMDAVKTIQRRFGPGRRPDTKDFND